MTDKLPEWPSRYLPLFSEYSNVASASGVGPSVGMPQQINPAYLAAWEQRCRLAVEALDAIACGIACLNGYGASEAQREAIVAVRAIGPLPPKEQP